MGINFPAAPTVGTLHPQPPQAGVPVYRWDGEKWTTTGAAATKTPVYVDGSTAMTAQLTLIAPPVNPTDAAAKSYVDNYKPIMFSFPFAGKPTAGGIVCSIVTLPVVVPASLTGSKAFCNTASSAAATFILNKRAIDTSMTPIGNIVANAGSQTGFTFTGSGGSLVAGDTLILVAPSTQDSALADVSITIHASRG